MPVALIKNSAGRSIAPSLDTTQEAVSNSPIAKNLSAGDQSWTKVSLLNSPATVDTLVPLYLLQVELNFCGCAGCRPYVQSRKQGSHLCQNLSIRLLRSITNSISRTMIMINTCFVFLLSCNEMIARKKYQLQ